VVAFRDQLVANIHGNHQYPSPHRPEHQLSNTANPHHHNIDPAIGGPGMLNPGAGDSGGDDNGSDGRKGGKRELSTSKRAAQNRAAQVRRLHGFQHHLAMMLRWFWSKNFVSPKFG